MYLRIGSTVLSSRLLCSVLAVQNPPPAGGSGGSFRSDVAISLPVFTVAIALVVLLCIAAVWKILRDNYAGLTGRVNTLQQTIENVGQQDIAPLRQRVGDLANNVTQTRGEIQQAITEVRANVTQVQQVLANLQGMPQRLADIQQTLQQVSRSDVTTQAIEQVQQEIAGMRSANQTVLSVAWSRLTPGLPPPFAPQISSVEPDEIPAAGGDIVIRGRNFSADCRIWFGPKEAQPGPGSNANQISVTAPAHEAGDVDVCIQSPNGLVSSPRSFTYRG